MGLCIKMNNPVMQLRKIVNHPYLVRWDVDPETGDYVVDEEMITDSGKLTVLDQMLTRLIKDGHRVSSVFFLILAIRKLIFELTNLQTLIFSQMTMMLDILADFCDLKGYKFARLDGSMSLDNRGEHMRAFNTDPDMHIFLISTRAGGLGINLTSADTVIIYDSDWVSRQTVVVTLDPFLLTGTVTPCSFVDRILKLICKPRIVAIELVRRNRWSYIVWLQPTRSTNVSLTEQAQNASWRSWLFRKVRILFIFFPFFYVFAVVVVQLWIF